MISTTRGRCNGAPLPTPPVHRVLIVEDHEPFRQAIRELLGHRPDVRIVGEAADGVDAIRQAEAQRPDVVLLDIGLPGLSGMEVADRIRESLPDARVMFVTNESSLEVAESAFVRGAHGYVYKPRAQRDVLPVFDAIVRGGRFVSGGLERIERGDSLASHRHQVLFYSNDATLVRVFTPFVADALHAGKAVILLLTETREQAVRHSLARSYADFDRAFRQGRYIVGSISETIATVMVDGRLDSGRFAQAAEELVMMAARRATTPQAGVAAAGDCSAMVWAQGHVGAALQFENLWDAIAVRHRVDTLCAYPMAARRESQRVVRSLCAEHTAVEIS